MNTHVLAPLWQLAKSDPDRLLLTWVDHRGRDQITWTAGEAWATFSSVAHQLRQRGLSAGDRALLVHPPGLEFVAALGGCLLAGILPVPIYPPQPGSEVDQRRLETLARAAGARIALTTRRFRWMQTANAGWLRLRGGRGARDLEWWSPEGEAERRSADKPQATADAPAFLQFTSGSTASPKGVVITHGNLEHQLAMSRDLLFLDAEARVVAWVPQYHDLGLISGILSCLWRGGPLWLMAPTTFLRDSGVWFDVAHRVRATHTAAPNFAWDHLVRHTSPERRAGWDLSRMRVLMSAAEPVAATTLRRSQEALRPCGVEPEAFCPAYGLAEHTVGVTLWGRGVLTLSRDELEASGVATPRPDGDLELVACGSAPPDVDIRIVKGGETLPERHVGEVWVDSPSRAPGYWQRPDLTIRSFGATLEGRSWLRTGDLGFLHEGQLFLTGRLKDIVLVRGRNIAAEELEESLRDVDPRVRPNSVAAFALPSAEGERIGLVVEVTRRGLDLQDLAQAILQRCQTVWPVPTTLVLAPPRSVLKTTSGKIRRRSTRTALEAGEIDVLLRRDVGDAPLRAPRRRPRAVVVGAGLSGLVVADRLQGEGWDVTVLEASDRVGGQLRTLPAGELGAMGFGMRWTRLRALTDELGLPTRQRLYSVGALREGGVDRLELQAALEWTARLLDAASGVEGLEAIGAAEWVASVGLGPLPESFQATWAFHGYGGETNTVSAASLLDYARRLDPDPRLWQLSRGNASLARALCDRIRAGGGEVHTRRRAVKLRSGAVVTEDGPIRSGTVVLAVPPRRAAALLGADTRSTHLESWKTHDYRSSVVTIEGLPRLPRCVTVPESFGGGSGRPLGMFRRSQADDDWTLYQLGTPISGGERLSDEALDRHCRLFLTRLGARVRTWHGSARWEHFPHLPPRAAGARSQLDALQGSGGLWLTGAWWGTATAEDAVVHAQALADQLLRS